MSNNQDEMIIDVFSPKLKLKSSNKCGGMRRRRVNLNHASADAADAADAKAARRNRPTGIGQINDANDSATQFPSLCGSFV